MALAEHYYGTAPGGDSAPDLDDLLELVARARPAWHADALCREYPSVTWFPDVGQSAAPAKAVCGRCAVQAECAAYARQSGETVGVWAGVSMGARKPPQRPRSRIVSDGAPARLREVTSPSVVAVEPTPPRRVPKPKPDRRVEHRAFPNAGNDEERAPAPASCARCPMPVKMGRELCKGCERAEP